MNVTQYAAGYWDDRFDFKNSFSRNGDRRWIFMLKFHVLLMSIGSGWVPEFFLTLEPACSVGISSRWTGLDIAIGTSHDIQQRANGFLEALDIGTRCLLKTLISVVQYWQNTYRLHEYFLLELSHLLLDLLSHVCLLLLVARLQFLHTLWLEVYALLPVLSTDNTRHTLPVTMPV